MPKTILIVEDSIDQQGLYQVALEQAGYAVQTAYSGQQALNRARQTAFDLIILDVHLPGSLTGLETLSQLKAHAATAAIPVLVISADHDRNVRQTAMESGAAQFWAKPFLLSRLLVQVEHILKSQPQGELNQSPGVFTTVSSPQQKERAA